MSSSKLLTTAKKRLHSSQAFNRGEQGTLLLSPSCRRWQWQIPFYYLLYKVVRWPIGRKSKRCLHGEGTMTWTSMQRGQKNWSDFWCQKEENAAHGSEHRRWGGGEGLQLQIPWCTYFWGFKLEPQHLQPGEEGPETYLLPKNSQTQQTRTEAAQELLPLHHGEHFDIQLYSMVLELHCSGEERPTMGGQESSVDHRLATTPTGWHLLKRAKNVSQDLSHHGGWSTTCSPSFHLAASEAGPPFRFLDCRTDVLFIYRLFMYDYLTWWHDFLYTLLPEVAIPNEVSLCF